MLRLRKIMFVCVVSLLPVCSLDARTDEPPPSRATQIYSLVTSGTSKMSDHPAEAEDLFKQALALEPENAYALGGLGCLRFTAGRFVESADYCEKAIRSAPNEWILYQDAIFCYFKLGLLQKVDDCLSRAKALKLLSAEEAQDLRNHTGPWAPIPEGDYVRSDGQRMRTIHMGRSPTSVEMIKAMKATPMGTQLEFEVDYWRPALP